MIGLRIDFDGTNPVIDDENSQSAAKASMQNNIVNFLTIPGSDKTYASRGTELARPGSMVLGFDTTEMQHECNFAALDLQQLNERVEQDASSYREKLDVQPLYCKVASLQRGVVYLYLTDTKIDTTFPVSAL